MSEVQRLILANQSVIMYALAMVLRVTARADYQEIGDKLEQQAKDTMKEIKK